jgi:hypothetical protein
MEVNGMEKQKRKWKFNIIDIAIIVVVIGGVAFGGYKYLDSRGTVEPPQRLKYIMVLDNVEIFDDTFANDKIKIGDRAFERTVNGFLGRVTKIESEPSWSFATTCEGEITLFPRPLSSRLIITLEGEGVFSPTGGLIVNGMQFTCNKNYEVVIADSIFWLRIVEIERL